MYALPRQRRHSFQNKFCCPFDQFYLRQFKRIGTPSTPNIAQINNLVLLSDRSLCIILFSPLIRISVVAQRLECATDTRVFTGSNHAWSFTPLNFASVFRKRLPLRCTIIGNVLNYFRIFLPSLPYFLMHAFIQSFNISMCKR